MPTSKKTAPVKASSAIAPKPKKKTPPPPPSHKKTHHEKPDKPGKKHGKHEDKPGGKHLRRVFEHLGRVEALQGLAKVDSVPSLVHLAQVSLDQNEPHAAADLLRAAEHLGFAAAAAQSPSKPALSPGLEEAIRREFRKLLEAGEDHDLTQDSTLGKLLRQSLVDARYAFDTENLRQALELARASEALAGISPKLAEQLDKPHAKHALRA